MKVNAGMKLLVISDALLFDPKAFIKDKDGNRLESGDAMRVLGFYFSYRPNVTAHVDALRRRFKQK